MLTRVNKVLDAGTRATQTRHGHPTIEETADEAGLSVDAARRAIKANRRMLSLDVPLGDAGENYLGELLPDQRHHDPLQGINQDALKSGIAEALGVELPRARDHPPPLRLVGRLCVHPFGGGQDILGHARANSSDRE